MKDVFRLHTVVRMGHQALESLRDYEELRVLVVTDGFLADQPLFSDLLTHFRGAVEVFSGVSADPSVSVVQAGAHVYLRFQPDVVIAYGGGSVMDAAKAMHKAALEAGVGAREGIVAVPSTSGSGSEVTSFAVITDEESQTKIPIVDPDMVARVAILDPAVVRGLPPVVTADSGMDVLTHALEAYVSTGANDFSDALAEKAASLVFEHLETCFHHGDDLGARAHMHHASAMAAMAFENVGLGITHSLAHALGGHFHVAHGRLNAMLLPHVVEYNASHSPTAAERYAKLGRIVAPEARGKAAVTALTVRLRKLAAALGIPGRMAALDIDLSSYRALLPEMVSAAMADGCTTTNPARPHPDDLAAILRAVA